MKKLSKILSRRARGADEQGSERALGPGLGPPSDFHQLPSRRPGEVVTGRDGATADGDGTRAAAGSSGGPGSASRMGKRTPRFGSSRVVAIVEEGAPPPCETCARIDFPGLLDWRPGDARPWVPLSHTLRAGIVEERQTDEEKEETRQVPGEGDDDGTERPCPYCMFFQTIIGAAPADGSGKRTSYLRIRLAFERLGGGERHGLGKSVLIEVTTGSRRLPWGYIVKAAEDDLNMAGYLKEMDPEQAKGGQGQGQGKGRDLLSVPNANTETVPGGRTEQKGTSTKDKEKEKGKGKGDGKGLKAKGTLSTSTLTSPAASTSTSINTAAVIPTSTTSIRGRTVTPLLDPALPRTWIGYCKNHHSETCGHASDTPFVKGLRLVDCKERCLVSIDDLEKDLESLEYVALSYVWGDTPADGQDGGVESGIPEELPPLIDDALSLTQAVGFRYLWVDRYCILPLEPAQRKLQIEQMGRIYDRAALTLIVAAGDSVCDGIPGVSTSREDQLSLETPRGLFTTSLLRPDFEIGASKWASRAWTYQEGLLSRRRLVLTPSQVYFQCQVLHCHESILLPLQLATELNLGRVFPTGGEVVGRRSGQLKNHIKTYMAREATFNHDRLDAFRGILHEYARPPLGVPHLLGLPLFHPDDFVNTKIVSQTDRLAVGLGWMPDRILPFQGHVDPYYRVDDTFPSWTWLAWRLRPGQTAANHNFHFDLVGETSPVVDGVCAAPGMEISVGFRDGMVVSWEIDGDAIARKADRIEFLRLETFCFDLEVECSDGEARLVGDELPSTVRDAVEAWVRVAIPKKVDEEGAAPVSEIEPDGEGKTKDSIKAGDEGNTGAEVKVETGENSAAEVEEETEGEIEAKTEVAVKAGTETRIDDNTEANSKEDPKQDTTPEMTPDTILDPKVKADQQQQPSYTIHLTGVLLSGRNWKADAESEATILVCAHRNWDVAQPLVRLGALGMAYDTFLNVDGKSAVVRGIHSDDEGDKKKTDLRLARREIDLY